MVAYKEADAREIPAEKLAGDIYDRNKPVMREHADPQRWGAYWDTKDRIGELRQQLSGQAVSGNNNEHSAVGLASLLRAIVEEEVTLKFHGQALRIGRKAAVVSAARVWKDSFDVSPQTDEITARRAAAKEFVLDEVAEAFGLSKDTSWLEDDSPMSLIMALMV